MNDNNINEEWFDRHQWQPEMPSTDVAWSDMLTKLEKEMPVNTMFEDAGKKSFVLRKKSYLLILLLLLLSIHHTNENLHSKQEQPYSTKTLPANAGIGKSEKVIDLNNAPSIIAQDRTLQNISSDNKHVFRIHKASNKNEILRISPTSKQKEDNIKVQSKVTSEDTVTTSNRNEIAILNSRKLNTQKSGSGDARLTDSLQNGEENNEPQKLSIQAGLQWTMPLPVAGTSNYFAGTSGTEQPWRILLPGVWVSVKADKNLLMAEVNPFASASFNPKSFYSNQEVDSVAILEKFRSITKVFGISGAISFQHNITKNWWAGAGLQASFWNKGIAVLIVNKHDLTTNVSSSSATTYVLSKEDWQYFSKMQLYPHLQLMYRGSKYQAGLRAGATFTSLAKDNGAKNLMFTELFFRLPLISNEKK